MVYFKLQIGCLLVVLYVTFMYWRERKVYQIKKKETIFQWLLITGMLSIIFDGATAYTVNHLEEVPDIINGVLHMGFLSSLDVMEFLTFLYIAEMAGIIPESRKKRVLLMTPLIIAIGVVCCFMPQLEYRHGEITNYSMGISAYTCFTMVFFCTIAILIILYKGRNIYGRHKLITISTCMLAALGVMIYQAIHPQALLTCLVPTFVIIGVYLNMENPLFTKLQAYNQEMVMGFATLVENRDGSTGGHIKRTTEYVKLLAEELREKGYYKEQLTEDYIKNIVMAAPMHDLGKIAIPDAILQKPGRLTAEEFETMKSHSEKGGKIIKDTFAYMDDEEYEKTAYEVARYHHEKWNGKGYPEGLSQKEIPLSARIMTVADVFDAVSAKRCYRDALPLEECFRIIEEGSGQDFDPVIAETFLSMKEKIKEVYEKSKVSS